MIDLIKLKRSMNIRSDECKLIFIRSGLVKQMKEEIEWIQKNEDKQSNFEGKSIIIGRIIE